METEKMPITLMAKAVQETFGNCLFSNYSPDQILVSFNSVTEEVSFYDKETERLITWISF